MNDFTFTYEKTPFELALESLGSSISAVRLLTLLEGEEEDAWEDALLELEQREIAVTLEDLPKDYGSGSLEKRLRREELLVRSGSLLFDLEEGDPLRLYLEDLAGMPAAGDPQLLALRHLEGDESAAQALVNVTISLAVEEAKATTGRGILLLDLIQEASLGLWQGILCYRDGDVLAHLRRWIRWYLAKAVVLQARENGTGTKLRKSMEAYRAADKQLLTQLGRNPTAEEIALELGITAEEAFVYQEMLRSASILEKAQKPASEPQPEDEQAVEDTAYFQSRQRILAMLSTLTEQEAQVLTLRFGLEGGLPCTPQEVGARLMLTPEQVVQTEAAALQKLRNTKED
jgi:RNA polymerase primary sigma factor